jgi:hypothetical protein
MASTPRPSHGAKGMGPVGFAVAIGDGLRLHLEVTGVPVHWVATDQLAGVDLQVVEGHTHIEGVSRPRRAQAPLTRRLGRESSLR